MKDFLSVYKPVEATKQKAVSIAGAEGRFITFLASQANVSTQCPEPTNEELLQQLLRNYTKDDIIYLRFAEQ